MPKAILELEMPVSCWDCPLQAISTEKKIRYCTVIRYVTEYYGTKRRKNCPLKLMGIRRLNNVRLSMDEVRKQHDGIKKLYEQGLRGATASVEQVLDLFDTIEALQQENEQLQAQLESQRKDD